MTPIAISWTYPLISRSFHGEMSFFLSYWRDCSVAVRARKKVELKKNIIYILILKCSKSLKEWQKIFKINLKRIRISSSSWSGTPARAELSSSWGRFQLELARLWKFFWPYSCKAYSIYSKKNIFDLSIMILGYFFGDRGKAKKS